MVEASGGKAVSGFASAWDAGRPIHRPSGAFATHRASMAERLVKSPDLDAALHSAAALLKGLHDRIIVERCDLVDPPATPAGPRRGRGEGRSLAVAKSIGGANMPMQAIRKKAEVAGSLGADHALCCPWTISPPRSARYRRKGVPFVFDGARSGSWKASLVRSPRGLIHQRRNASGPRATPFTA